MEIEEMNALLEQSNSEVEESLDAMNAAYNRVCALKEILLPDLANLTQEIRQARMTTERELTQTLAWLKTVREFFLEKSFEVEMVKLRELIAICKQVQALKEAGLLDAVSDLAIKLATKETAS